MPPRPMMWGVVLIAGVLTMLPPAARSSDQTMTDIDNTRLLLGNWVNTRKDIAEAKRQWAEDKEFLNNRVQVVQQEIDSLRSKIEDLKKNITETDTKRDALVKENEKLEKAAGSLNDVISSLETHCKQLLSRMPPQIQKHVEVLAQQIPADPVKTDMTVARRFQNVLGILNTLNKSSRDITIASEIRDLGDGRSAEVIVLYLGLSRAYYVSANGQLAGVGQASDTGWTWTADNAIAPQVAQAVAIFKNEQPASFVELPLTVK